MYLIVGDLHLGASLSLAKPTSSATLNSRLADQAKLLDWVLEKAQELGVHSIILTGDISEEPKPDYTIFQLFIDFLTSASLLSISVDIIEGNHDMLRYGSKITSFLDVISELNIKNIRVHKNMTSVIEDGVGLTFIPFRDRKMLDCKTNQEAIEILKSQLDFESECIPNIYDKVIIGHLALENSIFVGNEIDDTANELMCPISMFDNYNFTWMGHVHKPQVLSKENSLNHVAHVGSLDISNFGETNHQKIVILYSPNLPGKFQKIVVPTRPLRRVQVEVPIDFSPTNFVCEQVKAQAQRESFVDAIVKIEIKLHDNDLSIDRKIIEKFVYDLGAFHISNISESKIKQVIIQNSQINSTSLDEFDAIKIMADQECDTDDERKEYIELASLIIRDNNK